MLKKFIFFLTVFSLLSNGIVLAASNLSFGPLTVKQLEEIYKFYNYQGERGYLLIPGYHYPPLFLQSFPVDFNQIKDEKDRIPFFIKILAPLAMQVNRNIAAERRQIEEVADQFKKNNELTEQQSGFIEEKAAKYDIFSHLKGYQRHNFLIKELLVRVDELPPSFLIAVSAIETNWGLSRIVKDGNALYRQLVWHTEEGLKPQDETQDDSYRIKTYPNIYSSMEEFALKLNSHINYAPMRNFRSALRFRGTILKGTTFSYTLLNNSPLENYAGMLEYTIAFYELNIIDKSILDSKMIDKQLPRQYLKLLKNNKE